MRQPGLSIGPLLYFWPRERTLAFYAALADAPVDTVYLGETVCAKRRALSADDWIALGRELAAAGKEVVLSTLVLIEARSELGAVRRLCDNGEFAVEAGDMSAVAMLAERAIPFVGGAALNVYSAESLAVLARRGLFRWQPPVEVSGETLAKLQRDWAAYRFGTMPETEVFACGRIPLAWSARCFTARAHGRPKDDCGFVCGEYPDGLALETQTGERFLTLNGIQTQSGYPVDLFPHIDTMRALDIARLRVSPFGGDMTRLIQTCRGVIEGTTEPAAVAEVLGEPTCDGYWHGGVGMARGSTR